MLLWVLPTRVSNWSVQSEHVVQLTILNLSALATALRLVDYMHKAFPSSQILANSAIFPTMYSSKYFVNDNPDFRSTLGHLPRG